MGKVFTRKRLYSWHSWVGMHLGLILVAICVSGTVAVFTPELDDWLDPATTVEPPTADARKESLGSVIDGVRAAYPLARVRFARRGASADEPDTVTVAYSGRDVREVRVDPYGGEILAERTGLNLKSFVRIFHKQLFLVPSTIGFHGTLIVGALSFALLLAGITGLLALPHWRRAFFRLRLGRGRRTFTSDLHRLVGSWSLVVSIVLSLTGIWYLGEQIATTFDLVEHDPLRRVKTAEFEGLGDRLTPLSIDELIGRAQAEYPELQVTAISIPSAPGDPIGFVGSADTVLVRDAANAIALDPFTGNVVGMQRGTDLGLVARLNHTMDPVHFGTFGGIWTRWLFFLSGLALCVGIAFGTVLHASRTQKAARAGALKRSLWSASGLVTSLLLLLSALSGTGYLILPRLQGPSSERTLEAVGTAEVAGSSVHLFREDRGERPPALYVRFDDRSLPGCESLGLVTAGGEDPVDVGLVFGATRVRATPAIASADPRSLRLSGTTRSGEAFDVAFAAPEASGRTISAPPGIPLWTRLGILLFSLLIVLPTLAWLWCVRVPRRRTRAVSSSRETLVAVAR
ncbi:MAG: PepSY-associated TM helix domain-containing protein [Planctomycetota bacterium]